MFFKPTLCCLKHIYINYFTLDEACKDSSQELKIDANV